MMKRIAFTMIIALFVGSMVMAQQGTRSNRRPDAAQRAQRLTARMAQEYSLTDAQQKQLLEANSTLLAAMGQKTARHRAHKKQRSQNCCCCCRQNTCKKQATPRPRTQLKDDRKESAASAQTARMAYQEQLKKIMTKDQYAAYNKNIESRKGKNRKG